MKNWTLTPASSLSPGETEPFSYPKLDLIAYNAAIKAHSTGGRPEGVVNRKKNGRWSQKGESAWEEEFWVFCLLAFVSLCQLMIINEGLRVFLEVSQGTCVFFLVGGCTVAFLSSSSRADTDRWVGHCTDLGLCFSSRFLCLCLCFSS